METVSVDIVLYYQIKRSKRNEIKYRNKYTAVGKAIRRERITDLCCHSNSFILGIFPPPLSPSDIESLSGKIIVHLLGHSSHVIKPKM